MTERIKDGGPVHPIPEARDADGNGIIEGWDGMSQRAWLAGMAMNGLLSANAMYGGKTNAYALLARDALAHADAMLRALSQGASHD